MLLLKRPDLLRRLGLQAILLPGWPLCTHTGRADWGWRGRGRPWAQGHRRGMGEDNRDGDCPGPAHGRHTFILAHQAHKASSPCLADS